MRFTFLFLLLITGGLLNDFVSRPIHAGQLPTIRQIYEDRGVQKEVDVLLPSGSKAGIMVGSKGIVYTRDEDDNTESLIADIEVINIPGDGVARAKRTKGSASIKIKVGDIVKFSILNPLDAIPPTGSIRINNGSTYTKYTNVFLHLSATDNIGVIGYYISANPTQPSADAGDWQSVNSSISYLENISHTLDSRDGNKTIYVWYKDTAGNISDSVHDDIILDTQSPLITITSPTSDAAYTTTKSTISIGGIASDSTSGIFNVLWSNSNDKRTYAEGTTKWSVPDIPLQQGDNAITVTATDKAGNTSTDTIIVTYKDESATQSYDSKKIVATVNGQEIKKQELYNLMVDTYGEDALDVLIRRTLISQTAKKDGVSVSGSEMEQKLKTLVDSEIDALMRRYGIKERAELEKELVKVNSSIAKLEDKLFRKMRKQAEIELLAEKIMAKQGKTARNHSNKERLGTWLNSLIENASITKNLDND